LFDVGRARAPAKGAGTTWRATKTLVGWSLRAVDVIGGTLDNSTGIERVGRGGHSGNHDA